VEITFHRFEKHMANILEYNKDAVREECAALQAKEMLKPIGSHYGQVIFSSLLVILAGTFTFNPASFFFKPILAISAIILFLLAFSSVKRVLTYKRLIPSYPMARLLAVIVLRYILVIGAIIAGIFLSKVSADGSTVTFQTSGIIVMAAFLVANIVLSIFGDKFVMKCLRERAKTL
jgi:uncharacterized protein YacL